jgi:hypothetical protein
MRSNKCTEPVQDYIMCFCVHVLQTENVNRFLCSEILEECFQVYVAKSQFFSD